MSAGGAGGSGIADDPDIANLHGIAAKADASSVAETVSRAGNRDVTPRAATMPAQPERSRLACSQPLPATLAFLMEAGVPGAELRAAAEEAHRLGECPVAVLLAGGGLDTTRYYRALARHLGLPFLADPVIVEGIPSDVAIAAGHAPLAPARHGGDLRMVSAPRGAALAYLVEQASRHRDASGMLRLQGSGFPPGLALTDPARFEAAAIAADAPRIAYQAAHALPDRHPRFSHLGGARPWQRRALFGGMAAFALLPLSLPVDLAFALVSVLICLVSAFLALLRITTCREIAGITPKIRPPALDDAHLPHYSIVVALYREEAVAEQLCDAIAAIDYPASKRDVIFVIESDDSRTHAALRPHAQRHGYRILVAPDGRPRTKPRALNAALPFARGTHLVIYDAEDIPEPGQLRLAAETFAVLGPETVCLQARLAIDNDSDGFLPGCFAVEYAALFDVINPGFLRLGLPVPLGGTSNHFRGIM